MVANVSCGNDQYNHTINTLKYADRAKEIKTNVRPTCARGDALRERRSASSSSCRTRWRVLKGAQGGEIRGGAPRLSFFGGKTNRAAPLPNTGNTTTPPALERRRRERKLHPGDDRDDRPRGANEGNPRMISNPSAIDDANRRGRLGRSVAGEARRRARKHRGEDQPAARAVRARGRRHPSRCELASVEDRLVELEMTGAAQSPGRSKSGGVAASVAGDWRMVCARENAARRDRAAMDANEGKRREISRGSAREARESRGGKLPTFLSSPSTGRGACRRWRRIFSSPSVTASSPINATSSAACGACSPRSG